MSANIFTWDCKHFLIRKGDLGDTFYFLRCSSKTPSVRTSDLLGADAPPGTLGLSPLRRRDGGHPGCAPPATTREASDVNSSNDRPGTRASVRPVPEYRRE
ncbi:uncharacterized protein AAEQ78_017591 [Lycaon pictus]